LVVGKRGQKLKAGSDSEEAFIFGTGRVNARAMSMSALAGRLSGPVFKLERPVVDLTGIQGTFDFTLDWAPDDRHSGPSIFTALEEQLGLKLVVREIAVGILVVDHIERPTEN